MKQAINESFILKNNVMKNMIKRILQQPTGANPETYSNLRINTYLSLVVLLGILFTSCEDVIEVEINEENLDLYAVEASITNLEEPTVFLSKGLPVTVDETFKGISDALVTISDDALPANEVILVEAPDSAGYYVVPEWIDFPGVAGREYTMTIEVDGVILSASDYLAPVEPIDSIQVSPSTFGESEYLSVSVYSYETPGLGDYYKWDIYVNDTLLGNAEDMFFASDEFVEGNYVEGLEIFIDYNNEQQEIERRLKYMDTVVVRQNSVSEFAYNFYYQMQQQSYGGSIFSVPPANVKSNISSSNGKGCAGHVYCTGCFGFECSDY